MKQGGKILLYYLVNRGDKRCIALFSLPLCILEISIIKTKSKRGDEATCALPSPCDAAPPSAQVQL